MDRRQTDLEFCSLTATSPEEDVNQVLIDQEPCLEASRVAGGPFPEAVSFLVPPG